MARLPVAAAAPAVEVLVAAPEEDAPEDEAPDEVASVEEAPDEVVSEEDPVELAPLVVCVPLVVMVTGVEDPEELPEIVKILSVDIAAVALVYSEISTWISEVTYASADEGRLVTQSG
jgi:hypothetical protein